ncbi:transposable element Tcb1 transposase [Elysia marginata]|uniref:Transposable element Tcb1 transposase n=1 Tax=Elysia marginata TaxID=1093978 RepID=A0AAV4JUH6_9GAST|nr:transposable element Tcb1 transposase [Elysia marginata]
MNVNRTTIFRLRQGVHETDTVSDRPRSGRPRSTTQRQGRNLVRNHMNIRFLSASASSRQTRERNNQRISANRVRRRLSTSGLRARRPYIFPILTKRHRHQRTLRAQEHAAWDGIQWRSVVFSDQSRFCIDHNDGLVRVWRRSGERYQEDCVREHDRTVSFSSLLPSILKFHVLPTPSAPGQGETNYRCERQKLPACLAKLSGNQADVSSPGMSRLEQFTGSSVPHRIHCCVCILNSRTCTNW